MSMIEVPTLPEDEVEQVPAASPRGGVATRLLQSRFVAPLIRHIPPEKFGRYLLVGIWNTLFAYGVFALTNAVLTRFIPSGYIRGAAAVGGSSVINFTVAYLGYKWFVFKTKGNYLREWARCVVVYSTSTLLAMILLPALAFVVRQVIHSDTATNYIAGAILQVANAIYCFLGHSNFSFRSAPAAGESGLR